MDSRPIIIKKYGNRRLYDLTNSRYVNLEEVAQMVREGRPVQVVDAATNEDLTRTVLTQIIVEQAKADDSTFPINVLRQLIAASGRFTSQAGLAYLRSMFDVYEQAYRTTVPPVAAAADAPAGASPAGAQAEPADDTDRTREVDALRRRVDELERRVARASGPRSAKRRRPKSAR